MRRGGIETSWQQGKKRIKAPRHDVQSCPDFIGSGRGERREEQSSPRLAAPITSGGDKFLALMGLAGIMRW